MAEYKLLLPAMGEGVMEATVTGWLKNTGDSIEEDESVVEIATDKVDSDVPTPVSGIIKEILVQENEVVKVGEPLAILETDAAIEQEEEIEFAGEEIEEAAEEISHEIQQMAQKETSTEELGFLSPLVRSIVKKEKITPQEIESISGTGKEGRITKEDIKLFLSNRGKSTTSSKIIVNTPPPAPKKPAPKKIEASKTISLSSNPEHEIIEMDRMRKLIATHMVNSVQTAPHVSSFVETDVTKIWNWRNKNKNKFLQKEGEKLTFMPIFVEAIAKTIKDFPMINISVDGENIVKKKDINIGIATARPDGNLIVPVIKKADQYSLSGLAKQINDLANRARNNELQPHEIQGGTYTISNIGSFGNILGTPIINQPQVAILAIGAIEKKPAVIETPDGDMIGIRYKMYLSHSYDHRVVDGALGGMFVKRVSDYLENFNDQQEI